MRRQEKENYIYFFEGRKLLNLRHAFVRSGEFGH